MKIIFLSLFVLIAKSNFSQLADGSVAPDFNLTDINGTQQQLYDYLNQGKTVYIDFFACHCPYCWAYHNSHALSELYDQHGPQTGSDDVMVFAIELDPNNGNNEFRGISGVTQGDWVAGTNYPQLNPEGQELSDITSAFAVNFYPMIYAICPDKTITLIGKKTTDELYQHVSTCSTLGTMNMEMQQNSGLSAVVNSDKTLLLKMNDKEFISEFKLLDLNGKTLISRSELPVSEYLDVSAVENGVYLIYARSGNDEALIKIVLL